MVLYFFHEYFWYSIYFNEVSFLFFIFCINWISIKKQGLSYGFSALLMECYVFHPTLTYFVTKCPEVWELKQLKHKELVCQFFCNLSNYFFMIPSLSSLIGCHDMTFHAEWALAIANRESTKEGSSLSHTYTHKNITY